MCQVHTGAYVSLLVPGKTDFNRLPPKKDYHVYIGRSTYHYASASQTQVNWKKETTQRKEEKGEERKGNKRKRKMKEKKIRDKKNKRRQDKKGKRHTSRP